MRILVTGSKGFVGKNLVVRMLETGAFEVVTFDKGESWEALQEKVNAADAVVHLAGVNRPLDAEEFCKVNTGLTARLCDCIEAAGRSIPLIISSSTQAEFSNPYGVSKREAERAGEELAVKTGNPVTIYRLPNVFGKWCKPNYNSVVATFCHNIANDLPIQINDPATTLTLVYVDDVVSEIMAKVQDMRPGLQWGEVAQVFKTSLGELAEQIEAFRSSRNSLVSERVGVGFVRALYATYVSYLPPDKFSYDLPRFGDARGVFVEMLKTRDSGQFSFFTAHPGVTRGGHYHHTKTEKFLVIRGTARFGFRHVVTQERYEIFTSGDKPQIVETVPGWTHDITNVGDDEMFVMLWANEIFDRECPDTIANKV